MRITILLCSLVLATLACGSVQTGTPTPTLVLPTATYRPPSQPAEPQPPVAGLFNQDIIQQVQTATEALSTPPASDDGFPPCEQTETGFVVYQGETCSHQFRQFTQAWTLATGGDLSTGATLIIEQFNENWHPQNPLYMGWIKRANEPQALNAFDPTIAVDDIYSRNHLVRLKSDGKLKVEVIVTSN